MVSAARSPLTCRMGYPLKSYGAGGTHTQAIRWTIILNFLAKQEIWLGAVSFKLISPIGFTYGVKEISARQIRWSLEVRPCVLGRFLNYKDILPAQKAVEETQLKNNIFSGSVLERLSAATLSIFILAPRCTYVVW